MWRVKCLTILLLINFALESEGRAFQESQKLADDNCAPFIAIEKHGVYHCATFEETMRAVFKNASGNEFSTTDEFKTWIQELQDNGYCEERPFEEMRQFIPDLHDAYVISGERLRKFESRYGYCNRAAIERGRDVVASRIKDAGESRRPRL